ncbi:MAG: hypothetical protein KTR31_39910 [Myxococcales bacterium]|nr:hypothetical protein [Myxococcales bacterium]
MSILRAVESIRASEHMKLRMALSRAEGEMRRVEVERAEAMKETRPTDMFGDPIAPEKAPPENPLIRLNLRPLFQAWDPFETHLLSRMDEWEMKLWPLVRRWTDGEPVGEHVRAVTNMLQVQRQSLEQHLALVRREVSFVGPLRAPMMALWSALDVSDRAEATIFPGLLSGSLQHADATATRGAPQITGAQFSQILRSRPPTVVDPEEEVEDTEDPKSIIDQIGGRLADWIRR